MPYAGRSFGSINIAMTEDGYDDDDYKDDDDDDRGANHPSVETAMRRTQLLSQKVSGHRKENHT